MGTVNGWHAVRTEGGLGDWIDEISFNGEDEERLLSKLSQTSS